MELLPGYSLSIQLKIHTENVLKNKDIPQAKASVQPDPATRKIFCPLTAMRPERNKAAAK